jgi:hypothetical protein
MQRVMRLRDRCGEYSSSAGWFGLRIAGNVTVYWLDGGIRWTVHPVRQVRACTGEGHALTRNPQLFHSLRERVVAMTVHGRHADQPQKDE